MYPPHPAHQHNFRFYLVLITLVVIGILFVLNLNNDSNDGLGISGAMTGFATGNNDQTEQVVETSLEEDYYVEEVEKYGREVDVKLSFDEIPKVEKEETKITGMELRFNDLSTKINVNNDRLELNNLEEVNLRVKSFVGEVNINDFGISLDGTAKMLDVNGISLSSKGEIKLSFTNLDYQYLNIEEIELKGLELPAGNGELKVGEKLSYSLEQDKVKFNYFNGMLIIDGNNQTAVTLEGAGRGIDLSGALMNINLR